MFQRKVKHEVGRRKVCSSKVIYNLSRFFKPKDEFGPEFFNWLLIIGKKLFLFFRHVLPANLGQKLIKVLKEERKFSINEGDNELERLKKLNLSLTENIHHV